MNEEEARERLKYIDMQYNCNNYYSIYDLNCIETVLNLLEKKDIDYSDLKLKYEQNLRMCKHFRTELNKQDKTIELLTEFIKNNISEKKIINEVCIKGKCNNEECHEDDLKQCIKQYFERKIK